MFVDSMNWRKTVNADNIETVFKNNKHHDLLINYWPASAFWKDPPLTHDGSVIIFEALGLVDPSIIDNVGLENLVQYHIWSMEQLEGKWFSISQEKGYWPGFVMFEDLSGLGWHSLSSKIMSTAQEIMKINQLYYPDMLRKMWIINVPSIFYMSWKVIQLWLDPRTLAKIELLNGGIEDASDRVFQVVSKDKMPVRLGGTSSRDIPKGGPVGPSNMALTSDIGGWIDVGRGSSYDVTYDLDVGDILSWEFKTKNYDIGFGIFLAKEEVVKTVRQDADKRIIEGSIKVEKKGTYTFKWDNSYSWTRGKQIQYNIRKGKDLILPK